MGKISSSFHVGLARKKGTHVWREGGEAVKTDGN